jgi:hypothetical protein
MQRRFPSSLPQMIACGLVSDGYLRHPQLNDLSNFFLTLWP